MPSFKTIFCLFSLSPFFIFPGLFPFNDDSSLLPTPYSFCLHLHSHPLTLLLYLPHFCSALSSTSFSLSLSHLSFLPLYQINNMFWWLSNNSSLYCLGKGLICMCACVYVFLCVFINSTNQFLICSPTCTSSQLKSNRFQLHDFSVTAAEFILSLLLRVVCVCM